MHRITEADTGEIIFNNIFALAFTCMRVNTLHTQRDILIGGEPWEQTWCLENNAAVRARVTNLASV